MIGQRAMGLLDPARLVGTLRHSRQREPHPLGEIVGRFGLSVGQLPQGGPEFVFQTSVVALHSPQRSGQSNGVRMPAAQRSAKYS